MSNLTIIKPKKIFSLRDISELWEYKELIFFFIWRDFKVRYKQTAVGVAWAIFQPFITMVVFSVFFGKLAKMPSDGVPYPIFIYTGLLFWQLFSSSLTDVSNTFISNASIITKVYFPRLVLPIAETAVKFIDFFFSSIVLVFLMLYYGYAPSLTGILFLPLLVIMTSLSAVGLGLVLASINIKYRDVRYVLPFFIQLLLFVTPVIYPPSIAGQYSWVLAINPMTAVIKAARSIILGTEPLNVLLLSISLCSVIILTVIGIYLFKKTEGYFADVV